MIATRLLRNFVFALCVPLLLIAVGTIGFMVFEDLSFHDALYLAVMSLTTVGFGDVAPRTLAGRYFTMVLVLTGVFTVFYAATTIIRLVVSGELQQHLGRQQMERTLAQLRDHVIVCGYGRMGRLVCREFAQGNVPFVVIDKHEGLFENFEVHGGIPLAGDANSDEVLKRAGIDRARGLVTVMSSDSENLFTTMSARLLNPKLVIVARVEDAKSEAKLTRAGANRVVSPYEIGGARVAHAILRPTVMDFIELATRTEHIDLQLEETTIAPSSPLAGKTLAQARLGADYRLIVVAIKKAGETMLFNPDPQTPITPGDILVALGRRDQLQQLERLANPAEE